MVVQKLKKKFKSLNLKIGKENLNFLKFKKKKIVEKLKTFECSTNRLG